MTTSWVESANHPDSDFPVDNLPFGVFDTGDGNARCGVAIGDRVLDLRLLQTAGLLDAGDGAVFSGGSLNAFMALGPRSWSRVRERLTDLLAEDGDPALRDGKDVSLEALHAQADVTMLMPIEVAGYTDFYASRHHAFNAGSLLRDPQNALTPNWRHMPIGYNGRASTVVVSGTPIRRPLGQFKRPDEEMPEFGPSRRLDFELEMGAILGQGTRHGEPVGVAEADELIFGYVLLNDWSARDIQGWEAQPLGPFQSKAFGTTISPWVVTKAALEPFRVAGPERDIPLLPYLREPGPMVYDIALEAALRPEGSPDAHTITRTNARHLYYSAAQMLAHHAAGGCRMDVGDILGSGTISGPEKEAWACLLELTRGGREALDLNGVERRFLEDGDAVILSGRATKDGLAIGFGRCEGVILPARSGFPA